MRLINVHSYELREFWGDSIPRYAIFTHTWDDEEVSHQEWQGWLASTNLEVKEKKGFQKIIKCCEIAKGDELDWLWVDTNCIDKTSSAELSEAINSMFAWYRDASACYCYMPDVRAGPDLDSYSQDFQDSRWHTRGWTLQELLAVRELKFFSKSWSCLGTRSELASLISSTTGIRLAYLLQTEDRKDVFRACVAEKMSWVSSRKTTRVEDIAYCMLGIFEINMPLLYGEGTRAFTRLQEEIVRSSDDHTIFCWDWDASVSPRWVSMLAPSPQSFRNSADYRPTPSETATPYSITNMGLALTLPVIHTLGGMYAFLDAATSNRDHHKIAICLRQSVNTGMIFERSPAPQKPLRISMLYQPIQREISWKHFIVQTKAAYDDRMQPQQRPGKARLGFILLLSEDATQFFEVDHRSFPSRVQFSQPLKIKKHWVYTYPYGLFDPESNLIWLSPPLPPSETNDASFYTALLCINVGEQQTRLGIRTYYLFFAAHLKFTSVRDPVWITTKEEMVTKGLDTSSPRAVFDHFLTRLNGEKAPVTNDLQVTIGSNINVDTSTTDNSIRLAIISRASSGVESHISRWYSLGR